MKNAYPRKIRVGSSTANVYRITHHKSSAGAVRFLYRVTWYDGGIRREASFADEAKAVEEARIKAGQLAEGRVEGAQMTRSDRDELGALRRLAKGSPLIPVIEEWARGRELTGGNIIPACEAWAARNGTVRNRIKVADLVKTYLKAKIAAKRKTAKTYSSTLDRITKDFGEQFTDTISAKQIDLWLAKWDHPVTRNTYLKRLSALWSWARKQGYLPRETKTEAELAEWVPEPAAEIGIINVATWRSMLAYFRGRHPELLPALVIAGFCGLRRSEVHAQTWEDISLERKNLRVTSAKRGTPARRMVPLCPAAVDWLMLCKDRKGTICPQVEYRGKMQPALAMDGIRRIAREATITEGENEGKPMFPTVPENCFRHSYISHAVAASGDIPRVSLDAGNSPKEINKHYRELVSEDDGKAWFDSTPGKVCEVLPMLEEKIALG
jgi:integrase